MNMVASFRLLPACLLCLVGLNQVFAQQYFSENLFPNEGVRIDSVAVPVERINEARVRAGLDPLEVTDPLVTPDGKVWMYYERPAPRKKPPLFEIILPPGERPLALAPAMRSEETSLPPPPSLTITGLNFDDNGTLNGSYFIPPDNHGAVGTTHVCHVANAAIECHTKSGTLVAGYPKALSTFFSSLSPENASFDPRIIWDPFENRFVVVTLIKVNSSQVSRLLLAVSATSDPGGSWYFQAINTKKTNAADACWFDYPAVAVDEEAIYITGNYFAFPGSGNSCASSDVIIIDKGVSGGIYAGTTSANEDPATNPDFNIYTPTTEAGGGLNVTNQPARRLGGAPSGTVGTYLMGYSGLSDGTNEYLQYFRIDNPLGTISFTQGYLFLGDIENTSVALPDAPQNGSDSLIATNNRRALDAVWRGDSLWVVATFVPPSGADAGQATAVWFKNVATPTSIVFKEYGLVGGEDIATGTYTYFPSITVNASYDVAIGFSASAPSIYAGAYVYGIFASGAPGVSETVQAGVDYYVRTFGTGENRWGDYSATVVDPADNTTFWVINQAALTRGTATGSGEDGRWGMFLGKFNTLLPVEYLWFTAEARDGKALLRWATATESDNRGFFIEHMEEGAFRQMDFVAGHGTSASVQNYEWQSPELEPGTHIFRLVQVDWNGARQATPARSVRIDPTRALWTGPPRYDHEANRITFEVMVRREQILELRMLDLQGRVLGSTRRWLLPKGEKILIEWPMKDLPHGVYLLALTTENSREVKKIWW